MRIKPHKHAWYGCRRDTLDPRDKHFRPMARRLPASVDLRPHCPPVMDQGALGSCTAHGITAALRYLLLNAGKPDIPLARLQLYYDERYVEGTVSEDSGAEIRDGIKCAAKIGVAHEALWPYDVKLFAVKPTANVYTDALAFEALTYERVSVSATHLKLALADGLPVVIGISVFESFESKAVEKSGLVPMPDVHREDMMGGHCMLAVGYGQRPDTFTVQNSWNTDWGDAGFCYLPERYLGSPDLGSDYWLIRTVTD